MKFGLFDHIDLSDRAIAQTYDERLELIAAADEAGFYAYHLAEHHATPVSTTPVPSIFLGAVARLTKRIRLGPMVYLLPLTSPLRVIEEICILDHLSHGRLEVGVGRGTSGFEYAFNKVDYEKSEELFRDALSCVIEGLTHERLTYAGPHYNYTDVPLPLGPLQKPYPPIWYGSTSERSGTWAGEQGLQFVTTAPANLARDIVAAYSEALAKRAAPAVTNAAFLGGAAKGLMREIIVAGSDAEARRIAKPAHDHLYRNQTFLRNEYERGCFRDLNLTVRPTQRAGDFDDALREGTTIAGSPETVRSAIAQQAEMTGANYFVGYFMFGTMTLAHAMRSMKLFSTEIMPHFEAPLQVAASRV
jgi:alkanesulfonate monooxygenase SsuD/methylene tetrahydromethanopterin reductase-like flavin-dependent oxidoreductase (luciferase family)